MLHGAGESGSAPTARGALALHRGRTHATRKKGQRGGGLASHQAHTRVDEQIKPWRCEVVDDFFWRPRHHHQPQVDACERGCVCQRDNVRIVTPRFLPRIRGRTDAVQRDRERPFLSRQPRCDLCASLPQQPSELGLGDVRPICRNTPDMTGSRSTADPTQIHPSGYFGQPEVCDLGLTEASFERQLAEG